ncbi:hypothetical protein L1077_24530 [Pseudoalteromonas luteoviolacea]|uniref:hypothetical protein n=1 Tax=Pseudoalteromonas luteoviolacea TaxID=43657 RepID=UPI001F4454C2|nr:hypothetical protein [Pseudoalteromonas luteoviolacea]MCF6442592.1 hypothetical protein [Pseudoalteromonas luteoviolacea]
MKPFTKLLLIFIAVAFAIYNMKSPTYEGSIFIACLAFASYKTAHGWSCWKIQ